MKLIFIPLLLLLASCSQQQETIVQAQQLPHKHQMEQFETWIWWVRRFENHEVVCYTWNTQSISCMPKAKDWKLSTY